MTNNKNSKKEKDDLNKISVSIVEDDLNKISESIVEDFINLKRKRKDEILDQLEKFNWETGDVKKL